MDAAQTGSIDAAVRVVISDNPGAYALERARRGQVPAFLIERNNFASRSDFESAIVDKLKEHEVELICLAGYMRIVGQTLLRAFPNHTLNIHPALLPAFPGLEAQRQAFEHGVKVSGCTVHFLDAKVDHGPIICQTAVEVYEDDTVETLRQRILKEEHRLYPKAIQLYAEGRLKIEGRRVCVT